MNGRFINILAIELVIYTLVHDLTIVQFNLKKQSQANVLSKFQPMISGQVTSQIKSTWSNSWQVSLSWKCLFHKAFPSKLANWLPNIK